MAPSDASLLFLGFIYSSMEPTLTLRLRDVWGKNALEVGVIYSSPRLSLHSLVPRISHLLLTNTSHASSSSLYSCRHRPDFLRVATRRLDVGSLWNGNDGLPSPPLLHPLVPPLDPQAESGWIHCLPRHLQWSSRDDRSTDFVSLSSFAPLFVVIRI